MCGKCRVAIIDKSPLFSVGVVQAIRHDKRLIVVTQSKTAVDLAQIADEYEPDVLLMDTTVPGYLGAIQMVGLAHRNLKILLLASSEGWELAADAFRLGVHGYITRRVDGPELIKAILATHAGERYITPELAWHLAKNLVSAHSKPNDKPRLSTREQQVLNLISRGLGNREIANKLNLGLSTVRLYKTIVFRKLGARNQLEAVAAMNTIASPC
jgi:DNA-binding NarL/FixJ family response regulator